MPVRNSAWFGEAHGLSAGLVTTRHERDAVRRMQARIYADRGATYEIGIDGTIDDPWVDISDYIAVWGPDGHPLATLRLIPMTDQSLPTLLTREVDDSARKTIDHLEHAQLGEIASLAVAPRGFPPLQVSAHLYRAMFQHAITNATRTMWVASINSMLHRFMTGCMHIPLVLTGPSSRVAGLVARPATVDLELYATEAPAASPRTWRYMTRGLVVDPREHLAVAPSLPFAAASHG